MLQMDTPGKVDLSNPKKKMRTSKVRCTTLACQNGVWENEYLTESERRMNSESAPSKRDIPKVGIRKVIGELQAKLTEMKQRFAEIRARFDTQRYADTPMLTFVCIKAFRNLLSDPSDRFLAVPATSPAPPRKSTSASSRGARAANWALQVPPAPALLDSAPPALTLRPTRPAYDHRESQQHGHEFRLRSDPDSYSESESGVEPDRPDPPLAPAGPIGPTGDRGPPVKPPPSPPRPPPYTHSPDIPPYPMTQWAPGPSPPGRSLEQSSFA